MVSLNHFSIPLFHKSWERNCGAEQVMNSCQMQKHLNKASKLVTAKFLTIISDFEHMTEVFAFLDLRSGLDPKF